jgi:hypothetical protein
MQWYVHLITVSAMAVFGWLAFEFLVRPIQAFFDLRRRIIEKIRILGDIPPPRPREMAVSSREINEYSQTMKQIGEAQRTFRHLGSQLLAFVENEPIVRSALVALSLDGFAAGNHLIDLSARYSDPHLDRAELCDRIKKTLGSIGAMNASAFPRARKLHWRDFLSAGRWSFAQFSREQ